MRGKIRNRFYLVTEIEKILKYLFLNAPDAENLKIYMLVPMHSALKIEKYCNDK